MRVPRGRVDVSTSLRTVGEGCTTTVKLTNSTGLVLEGMGRRLTGRSLSPSGSCLRRILSMEGRLHLRLETALKPCRGVTSTVHGLLPQSAMLIHSIAMRTGI